MGCCFSDEPDPVVRLAKAPALTQKTLTFSKPMPHTQAHVSSPTRADQRQKLVQRGDRHRDSDDSDEDGDAVSGPEDLDTGNYVSPDVDDPSAAGEGNGGGGPAACGLELVFESGWLKKEPLHLKGKPKELSLKRQERFFHLKGTVILYYKDECDRKGLCADGSKARLKGGLRLVAGVSSVKLMGRRITLTGLTTAEQEASLYMFVRTAHDGETWRDALQRAIDYAKATADVEVELEGAGEEDEAVAAAAEEDDDHDEGAAAEEDEDSAEGADEKEVPGE